MSLLADISSTLKSKISTYFSDESLCNSYKIIDFIDHKQKYLIQCVNTNGIFHSTLNEIVFDQVILYGLFAIQACYIGIEYSRQIKDYNVCSYEDCKKNIKIPQNKYRLISQYRNGSLCFIDNDTQEKLLMLPYDIAVSENLICHFNSQDAFQIGIIIGTKLRDRNNANFNHTKLQLIKG